MAPANNPVSIRILYFLTQFVFWLYAVVGGLLIVGGIFFMAGFRPDNIDYTLTSPWKFDLLEQGEVTGSFGTASVRIIDASGKLQFSEVSGVIPAYLALGVIAMILIIFRILWDTRKFMIRINRGVFFDFHNIQCLKRIAYGLSGLWILVLFTRVLLWWHLADSLTFETLRFHSAIQPDFGLLLAALFLWLISHIFAEGLRLREDSELTV